MSPRAWSPLASVLAIPLLLAAPLRAQAPQPDTPAGLPAAARWELVGALLLAEPVGEFGRYIDGGGGLGLAAVRYVGPARRLGIRAELSLVSYGRVSTTRELVLGGVDVDVDVTTENAIASFAIGPQYLFGRGRVRPWLGASIGSAQFVTTTSAWSGTRPVPIASAEVLEHHVLALAGGGGARVALWPRRRHPISLEIEARYHRHGPVEYLREGGVRDLPDGSVALDPVTSDADLWTARLGLVVGFR